MVGGLKISFQDVASIPPTASFCISFITNCGRGYALGTTTCLETVVGVMQGHAPVKYLCSNEFSFCVCLFV